MALPVEPVICQCLFRVAFRINILADRTCHTSFDLLLLKWTKNRLQFHGLTWGKLWQTLDDDVENSESKTEKSSAQVFLHNFFSIQRKWTGRALSCQPFPCLVQPPPHAKHPFSLAAFCFWGFHPRHRARRSFLCIELAAFARSGYGPRPTVSHRS